MSGEILKGHLDLLLLAAVRAKPSHGYAIIEEMERKSRRTFEFHEGTVYPALRRLEHAGLVQSRWVTEGGRKRRVYRLTAEGEVELGVQVENWDRFSKAVRWIIAEAT